MKGICLIHHTGILLKSIPERPKQLCVQPEPRNRFGIEVLCWGSPEIDRPFGEIASKQLGVPVFGCGVSI